MSMPEITKFAIVRHQDRNTFLIVTVTPADVMSLLNFAHSAPEPDGEQETVLVVHGVLQTDEFDLSPGSADELCGLAQVAERRRYRIAAGG